jgi:hypothetical protein
MNYSRLVGLLATAWAVSACGGAAIPQAQLTTSEKAISAAEGGGAKGVPKAALHLKQAQDQVAEAKKLIEEEEDMERADWVLRRAQADAELALTMAQEDTAKAEASEAVEMVKLLREKLKSGGAK